jgi:hypothetical protein
MLKMQHPVTGGVFHKVTTRTHASWDMLPENDREQLYLSPVSAQAAGSYAAAMAHASRFYAAYDPGFSARCISAAEKAWSWLKNNPETKEYKDPSFFRTGAYGDTVSFDERCWAAAELYSTTGAEEYQSFLNENPLPEPGFGWRDNGSYAMIAYLLSYKSEKGSALYNKIKEHFLCEADRIVKISKADGYGIGLEHYPWGSNMDAANNAMALLLAYKLEPCRTIGKLRWTISTTSWEGMQTASAMLRVWRTRFEKPSPQAVDDAWQRSPRHADRAVRSNRSCILKGILHQCCSAGILLPRNAMRIWLEVFHPMRYAYTGTLPWHSCLHFSMKNFQAVSSIMF